MKASVAGRLLGIEALRGMASTAVILYHASRHVNQAYGTPGLAAALHPGHAGVDLFFVLSGFIILFVHRRDIDRPDRLAHYAGRRFNRVLPLYWVALGITVLMSAAGSHGLPSLDQLAWSATLLPVKQEPVLGIAWTLKYEIVFYAVFAVLILSRRAGLAALAVWFAASMATAAGTGVTALPSELASGYCLEFFMGMGAALLVQRGIPSRAGAPWPLLLAAAGVLGLAAAGVLEVAGTLGAGDLPRFAYGIPAALLIAGAATAERAGQVSVPGWLQVLGGASYSLYLFQFVFIGAMWQVSLRAGLDRMLPPWGMFALLAAAALIGGVLVAQLVERPLLRLVRGAPRPAAARA